MDSQVISTRFTASPVWKYVLTTAAAIGVGFLAALQGIPGLAIALSVPAVVGYFILFFRNPKVGVFTVLILSFMLPTFGRYVPLPIPFGMGVDILLVLTYIILFLRHFKKLDFTLAGHSYTYLMCIWMGYIFLQIANPEARSIAAWFYAMRGMALYQFLIVPLAFVLLTDKKDWYTFWKIWIGFSILSILWGYKQSIFGVSAAEQAWLNAGAATTHILFGKLRVFSNYFDAGTYGAAMGQICIMSCILLMGPFKYRTRVFYGVLAAASFYAMMISGTRGALAVPAIGGMAYLVMIRNFKYMIIGAVVLGLGFSFLQFTYVANSNYHVYRLRSALNPEDASLGVRQRNRERLTRYLEGKPFGGGVGSAGAWGQKFTPGTWLANFPPDGLYTRIRAETGVYARTFYVGMWLFLLGLGIRIVWRHQNQEYKTICMAVLAGYAGLLMANLGNEVMTQFPINLCTLIALTFVFNSRHWNEEGKAELPDQPTPKNGERPSQTSWSKFEGRTEK